MIECKSYDFTYSFPATAEPQWKDRVDRWYQLDAYSFGLCQAYWHWKSQGVLTKLPQMIFLASPSASNEADWDFVRSDLSSPAKFAHTLPSVRASPLLQTMGWIGPVLCVQNGLSSALRETEMFLNPTIDSALWVISVKRNTALLSDQSRAAYSVVLLECWPSKAAADEENSSLKRTDFDDEALLHRIRCRGAIIGVDGVNLKVL